MNSVCNQAIKLELTKAKQSHKQRFSNQQYQPARAIEAGEMSEVVMGEWILLNNWPLQQ